MGIRRPTLHPRFRNRLWELAAQRGRRRLHWIPRDPGQMIRFVYTGEPPRSAVQTQEPRRLRPLHGRHRVAGSHLLELRWAIAALHEEIATRAYGFRVKRFIGHTMQGFDFRGGPVACGGEASGFRRGPASPTGACPPAL
jgi:hypothetical protein